MRFAKLLLCSPFIASIALSHLRTVSLSAGCAARSLTGCLFVPAAMRFTPAPAPPAGMICQRPPMVAAASASLNMALFPPLCDEKKLHGSVVLPVFAAAVNAVPVPPMRMRAPPSAAADAVPAVGALLFDILPAALILFNTDCSSAGVEALTVVVSQCVAFQFVGVLVAPFGVPLSVMQTGPAFAPLYVASVSTRPSTLPAMCVSASCAFRAVGAALRSVLSAPASAAVAVSSACSAARTVPCASHRKVPCVCRASITADMRATMPLSSESVFSASPAVVTNDAPRPLSKPLASHTFPTTADFTLFSWVPDAACVMATSAKTSSSARIFPLSLMKSCPVVSPAPHAAAAGSANPPGSVPTLPRRCASLCRLRGARGTRERHRHAACGQRCP
ncbi:hypothetical protein, conserved in T. vivax [Trypanosoma vivax Y486]|uniref:Proteophosphoglycan ppg4 n=1 Tax=Trypanosoma vivax (strain Y486) TaxID=1055687 RepID=F9WV03_TRYVY|nr:hypothetical protein, conserved in T. vivax [Trypanosoma vivax Y486]|eukprot:CCD21403.1 hypothetical protein, conserved in T. vivax [Trypanosoma vivax Y486]